MTKKVYKQKYSSVISKNLNWEILTKNLVIFKRWDGVKNEKFQYYGDSLKNPIFRGGGGSHEKPIYRGKCLKKGLGQFADLRWGGGLAEEEGWYPNAPYEQPSSKYVYHCLNLKSPVL